MKTTVLLPVISCPLVGAVHVTEGAVVSIVNIIPVELPARSKTVNLYIPHVLNVYIPPKFPV
ncbi:MAG: hypothetical protein WCP92_10100 [bacterium]